MKRPRAGRYMKHQSAGFLDYEELLGVGQERMNDWELWKDRTALAPEVLVGSEKDKPRTYYGIVPSFSPPNIPQQCDMILILIDFRSRSRSPSPQQPAMHSTSKSPVLRCQTVHVTSLKPAHHPALVSTFLSLAGPSLHMESEH